MMFTLVLSLKIGRSGLYTFVLSFQQLGVIICSIWKFVDDWIQTADLS